MTDVLFERFAALADLTDDSDWDEVCRRAYRGRRRYTLPVLAAAAAAAAAAALAAGNGWLITSHDRQVTAVTTVTLHGASWRVSVTTTRSGHWLPRPCVRFARPNRAAVTSGCRRISRIGLGLPSGAQHIDVAGGQIWAGATPPFIRRVAITDDDGRVHAARTAAAPSGAKTPFRYWAIALENTARSIVAYDARGHAFRRTLP